jgi:hypothetical protein
LASTVWEGTAVSTWSDSRIHDVWNVTFEFYSTNSGSYIAEKEGYASRTASFNYSINQNVMSISAGSLQGDYTVLDANKDRMILECRESDGDIVTLTLYRQ